MCACVLVVIKCACTIESLLIVVGIAAAMGNAKKVDCVPFVSGKKSTSTLVYSER